jgi:hypothetical protein
MPFTPIHLGVALPVKAVSEKKFNFLIFAWAQVVMDLQPLVVLLTQRGKVHGWTHTFLAALALGALTSVSGKYAIEGVTKLLKIGPNGRVVVPWKVANLSALFGTVSHVFLDALIYPEMAPFWPLSQSNPLYFGITSYQVIVFCLACGALGGLAWAARVAIRKVRNRKSPASE